jgi:phosphatidate cytidylyltransferase
MGVIVGAVLVLATVVLALLSAVRPGAYLAELWARTRSWWIMAAVFFAAAGLGGWASLALFAFMSFWAMKEYVTLLPTRTADHAALVLAFLAVPVQYLWVAIGWYGMFIIFIPVYMFLILPVRLVLSKETSGFVASASQIQWGLMAFVFGLSHMSYLDRLHPSSRGQMPADAGSLLLFLVFVVETSDVLQFLWGKTLGRHRVVPTVSPNKTWEGLIGGVLSASALAMPLRFLTPFSPRETFGVALLVTVAGFFGGTVMSAVKRDFGVKDFGELIPGHGGMLDRLDGLCYAAPVFFHYVRYFHT